MLQIGYFGWSLILELLSLEVALTGNCKNSEFLWLVPYHPCGVPWDFTKLQGRSMNFVSLQLIDPLWDDLKSVLEFFWGLNISM